MQRSGKEQRPTSFCWNVTNDELFACVRRLHAYDTGRDTVPSAQRIGIATYRIRDLNGRSPLRFRTAPDGSLSQPLRNVAAPP